MALVTGILNTFGVSKLNSRSPRILFIPSGPGVIPTAPRSYLLASEPIEATIALDGETFSVNLFPTPYVTPDTWFTVAVEWLDPGSGFTRKDFPDWVLRVPVEGGYFADLLTRPIGYGEIWISSEVADPPGAVRGDYVFNPLTDDLDQII